jgi:antitoxin SocA-like protein
VIRPEFDQQKFDNLVLYIASRSPDSTRLDAAAWLRKILYFADMRHYLRTARPLTGATYVKWEHAPMPKELKAALRRLQQADKLRVRERANLTGWPMTSYLTLADPDLHDFTADEISDVDTLIRAISGEWTPIPISEWTRNRAFEVAEIGEVLPYESFLVLEFAEITPEDMAWARREIDQGKHRSG